MKRNFLIFVMTILIATASVSAQTSWLDRPLTNWNNANGVVPTAPRPVGGEAPTIARCADGIRQPESLSDRALTRAGWTLFGASQTYGAVTLIHGMASVDGMCRPNQYNTFIFVGNRFAGTLSPTVMNSRTDGALSEGRLNSATNVSAEFTRYTSSDALCCPSQTSTVSYSINNSILKADNVDTSATCQQNTGGGETNQPETGVVRGTIKYLQRMALPRNAVITVRLVEMSRQDAASNTIVEQQINAAGQQVPIPFELKFEPNRINARRRYSVQAEIVSNGRTIFTTDKEYLVLTQGNPNEIEVTVVPGNSTGNTPPTGNNSGLLRGNVTYLQRIALAPNSTVTVRLVDVSVADTPSATIAEDTFNVNNRQVPIPFELRFDQSKIDARRKYALQAEINSDGKKVFITDTVNSVLTQGSPTTNITLTLVSAKAEPVAITGQTISLSKFGTGSFQIEGRSNEFIIRANVNIKTDGSADVIAYRINGGIPFTGKLTFFDQNTLRITVQSSNSADASGEIEVKYRDRRIDSITSSNLVLDGQKATIRF